MFDISYIFTNKRVYIFCMFRLTALKSFSRAAVFAIEAIEVVLHGMRLCIFLCAYVQTFLLQLLPMLYRVLKIIHKNIRVDQNRNDMYFRHATTPSKFLTESKIIPPCTMTMTS